MSANLSAKNLRDLPKSLSAETRALDVSFNALTSLDADVLAALTDLRVLNVSGNKLTELPHAIGYLTALRELSLNGNQLKTLGPEIGNLRALRVLNASNNAITALPRHIGRLGLLQELRLDGNSLESISLDLGELRSLQVLDLANCNLRKLAEQLCLCTGLIELNLSNNSLAALPVSLGRLTRLAALTLSHNRLTDVPLSLGLCAGITRLDISHNPLTNATLVEKAQLGTDHVMRFLANRMSATGASVEFAMPRSTISRQGHTIKMTTRAGKKREKAPRAPAAAERSRKPRAGDADHAHKVQRLVELSQQLCDDLLSSIAQARKRLQRAVGGELVEIGRTAQALLPDVRHVFELLALPQSGGGGGGRSDDGDEKLERLRVAADRCLLDAMVALKALQRCIADESVAEERRLQCVQLVRNLRSLWPDGRGAANAAPTQRRRAQKTQCCTIQ
jgi:Leucine-rich repeat (LRR) protein